MQNRCLRVILCALTLGILIYIAATAGMQHPVASAHAFVIGSDPVDGSTVTTVPEVVRIYFNAEISSLSTVTIYAIQEGKRIDVTGAPAHIPPAHPRQLDTPLKSPANLTPGSYEIRWMAVSNTDGHTSYGIIGFNVGFSSTGVSGTPTLGPTTSNNLYGPGGVRVLDFVNMLNVAWSWLMLMALTFWIGILVAERLILARIERTRILLERVQKQSYALQSLCLSVLLFGEVVTLILYTVQLSDAARMSFNLETLLQLLTRTNYGYLWLIRCAMLLVTLLLLRWTQRVEQPEPRETSIMQGVPRSNPRSDPLRPRTTQEFPQSTPKYTTKELLEREHNPATPTLAQRYTPVWLLLAGFIVLTLVLSGDAAQVLSPHASAITFDWLRYIAQGIWFGGLTYLAYILLPLLSVLDRDHRAETLVASQRRFTPFHIGSMLVLLLSTLFLSEASISNMQQLLTDPYGRTLAVQVSLILLIFLLSLYIFFAIMPRLTRQALLLPVVGADLPARRTRQSALENTGRQLKFVVSIQSWLAAGTLFCAALMSFYAPPIVFPDVNYSNNATEQTANTTAITQTQQAGDLSVSFQLLPGKLLQENVVIMTVTDRNGNFVTDAQVRLSTNMPAMDMGTAHATLTGGNPVYTTTFANHVFNMTGLWYIDASIERPDAAPVRVRFHTTIS